MTTLGALSVGLLILVLLFAAGVAVLGIAQKRSRSRRPQPLTVADLVRMREEAAARDLAATGAPDAAELADGPVAPAQVDPAPRSDPESRSESSPRSEASDRPSDDEQAVSTTSAEEPTTAHGPTGGTDAAKESTAAPASSSPEPRVVAPATAAGDAPWTRAARLTAPAAERAQPTPLPVASTPRPREGDRAPTPVSAVPEPRPVAAAPSPRPVAAAPPPRTPSGIEQYRSVVAPPPRAPQTDRWPAPAVNGTAVPAAGRTVLDARVPEQTVAPSIEEETVDLDRAGGRVEDRAEDRVEDRAETQDEATLHVAPNGSDDEPTVEETRAWGSFFRTVAESSSASDGAAPVSRSAPVNGSWWATRPNDPPPSADPAEPSPSARAARRSPAETAAEQAAADLALLRTFGVTGRPHAAAEETELELSGALPEDEPSSDVAQPVVFRVTHRDGPGVAGASVTLLDDHGRQAAGTVTDPDGRGALTACRYGGYMLVTTAAGFQPGATTIAVTDAPLDVAVQLLRSASIAGVVSGEDGPLVGAQVALVQDGEIVDTAVSAVDGAYRFDDLGAGEYGLSVNAPECEPAAVVVRLGEEVDLRRDVDLDPAGLPATEIDAIDEITLDLPVGRL